MCWSRALLILLVQLLSVEAVPISIDKTKVKEPEKKEPEEPPASVVRSHIMFIYTPQFLMRKSSQSRIPVLFSYCCAKQLRVQGQIKLIK